MPQAWLTRFKMDYAGATWKVDAVWPNVGNRPVAPGLRLPANRQLSMAGSICAAVPAARACSVYRLDGDRWLLSAGILRDEDGRSTDRNGSPGTTPTAMARCRRRSIAMPPCSCQVMC